MASIWCGWGNSPKTCHKSADIAEVPADVTRAPCFAFNPPQSGACGYTLTRDFIPGRVNDGSYPPLFYGAMRVFVGDSVAESVVRIRVANVCLAAILLGAAVMLMPPLLRRAVALSWLGTLVPLFLFLVPSTNPSSWVLIGVGTYWAWLLLFLTESNRSRTYLAGGFAIVSALMAGGARSDGAAYIGLSTLVVAIIVLRKRSALLSLKLLVPAALVAVMLYIYFTSGQSVALGGFGENIPGPGRTGSALLLHNSYHLPTLLLGSFGMTWGLGWLDTILPPEVGVLSAAVAGALVVVSASAMWRRKAAALAMVFVALVAIPLYSLQGGGNLVGENVQPRYLLPLITLTIGLCLLAESSPGRMWHISGFGMVLLVAALSFANVLALEANIRRYVTGIDVPGDNLNVGVEWWWKTSVTPMTVWIIGCVAGSLLFAALAWASVVRRTSSAPGSEQAIVASV